MSAIFGYVYVFFVTYLIPFLFAVGLIFFIYGCINYYIIGPGEEPKKEEGRHQLLWTFLFFLTGLIIYGVVAGFIWLGNNVTSLGDGIETGENIRIQGVPNTPSVPRENN